MSVCCYCLLFKISKLIIINSFWVIYCFEQVLLFQIAVFLLWRTLLTNWSKVESSIPITTHTHHTQHQCLRRLSHQKQQLHVYLSQSHAIIWHNAAHSVDPLFSGCAPSHSFTPPFHLLPSLFILNFARPIRLAAISHSLGADSVSSSPLPSSFRRCIFDLDRNQQSSQAETYQNVNDDRYRHNSGSGRVVRPMIRASRGQPNQSGRGGCRGFPEVKWSACLLMSLPSPLLAVAGMVTSSTHSGAHWEDLMEIMAGFVAVILSSMLFFFSCLPIHAEIITSLCVTSDASVTFSACVFQPSVSQRFYGASLLQYLMSLKTKPEFSLYF